ncbi:response regulator [Elusimicrobiota bacterium]
MDPVKKKILVVDDEEGIIHFIEKALGKESYGYELKTANDGFDAILWVEKFKPDLIILDIGLPLVDGIKLTQLIRSKNNAVSILAISGKDIPGTADEIMSAGADQFLPKPFEVEELLTEVKALLEKEDIGRIGSAKRSAVMIVEDHYAQVRYMQEVIEAMGYDVICASDTAEDAVRKAIANKPDIIIMDVQIKGNMDGIDVAKRIREEFCVPIIFVSACDDAITLQRAKEAQANGYLMKPYKEDALRCAIEKALFEKAMN